MSAGPAVADRRYNFKLRHYLQEEVIAFLKKRGIAYDPRYVFA